MVATKTVRIILVSFVIVCIFVTINFLIANMTIECPECKPTTGICEEKIKTVADLVTIETKQKNPKNKKKEFKRGDLLPPNLKVDMKYCSNGECVWKTNKQYGFKYRDWVCPHMSGSKYLNSYENQARVYYELHSAFLEVINAVKIDIPVSERYFVMCNAGLEIVREDGLPVPWHLDADWMVDRKVLIALRDQGFHGKTFFDGRVRFDIDKECHKDYHERSKASHLPKEDDAGLSYGGGLDPRLQLGNFVDFNATHITRGFGDLDNKHTRAYYPKSWLYPARNYTYIGLPINGWNDLDKYLTYKYGANWRTPAYSCDLKTKKWDCKKESIYMKLDRKTGLFLMVGGGVWIAFACFCCVCVVCPWGLIPVIGWLWFLVICVLHIFDVIISVIVLAVGIYTYFFKGE